MLLRVENWSGERVASRVGNRLESGAMAQSVLSVAEVMGWGSRWGRWWDWVVGLGCGIGLWDWVVG